MVSGRCSIAQAASWSVRALDEPAAVEAILLWSALPGASRHHWGTDVDVVDRSACPPGYRPQLMTAEFAPRGIFAKLDGWLAANMGHFGFFRPYTRDRGGVLPEPWHLSYAPVSVAGAGGSYGGGACRGNRGSELCARDGYWRAAGDPRPLREQR